MDRSQTDPLPVMPAAGAPDDRDGILAERQSLERERAALRIQAMAVAAQQAALVEEEIQLRQQQQAFERQQEQLAAHLDARRQRLRELQQRVQQARDELRSEQNAHRQETREFRARWEQGQTELAEALRGVAGERERLQDLRRRLKHRWHRQWAGERARLKRQEDALVERQAAVNRMAEALLRERATLAEERLRFNGERELGRRRLQDAWRRLRQEQNAWTARCAGEREQLDRAAANLAQAERDAAARLHHMEQVHSRLATEADGLELRVSNLRRKLLDQEQERRRLDGVLAELRNRTKPPTPDPVVEPAPPATRLAARRILVPIAAPVSMRQDEERGPVLEAFAAKVADSRSQLLEHCVRLLHAWEHWHRDHESATGELTSAAARLAEREQEIARRERSMEGTEAELHQRHTELMHAQYQLESWQTRLRAGEAAWRVERESLLAKVHIRETHAARQTALLVHLREHWAARRRRELDALRGERARCEDTQRRHAELCEEALLRNQELEREARDLALRALSLEEYRLRFLATANNAVTTERRMVRLRQRWDKRFAAAERKLARDASALTAAVAGLDEQVQALREFREDLYNREQSLDRDRAAWEHERALAEITRARMEGDVESHRLHRELLERQVGEERAEVERVVHTLLLEGPAAAPSVMRAA